MESSSTPRISALHDTFDLPVDGLAHSPSLRLLFAGEFDPNTLSQKIEAAEYLCNSILKRVENPSSRRIKLMCSKQKCPLVVKLDFSSTSQKYHLKELVEQHNHRVQKEKFQEKILTSRLVRYSDFIYDTYFLTESELCSKPKLILKDLKSRHNIDIMAGNFQQQQKQKLKKKFDNIIQQLRLKKMKSEPGSSGGAIRSQANSLSTIALHPNPCQKDNNNSEQNTAKKLKVDKSAQQFPKSQCKVEQDEQTSESSSAEQENNNNNRQVIVESPQQHCQALPALSLPFNQNIFAQQLLQQQAQQQLSLSPALALLMKLSELSGMQQNIISQPQPDDYLLRCLQMQMVQQTLLQQTAPTAFLGFPQTATANPLQFAMLQNQQAAMAAAAAVNMLTARPNQQQQQHQQCSQIHN